MQGGKVAEAVRAREGAVLCVDLTLTVLLNGGGRDIASRTELRRVGESREKREM